MSTNSIFSGNSRYSIDFQQIIDRAVAIASLPMAQMQNEKNALSAQSTALNALDTRFTSLQSAIVGLGSAAGSYSTSVSDGTVASASVTSGALEGAYSVQVIGIGSYTNAMSKDGLTAVSDPASGSISSSPSFTLTAGGVEYDLTPAANTLTALAEAINASGADVQATIVNIGPSSAPDYRLSIRSTKLGDTSVQLNDGTSDLLDTLSTGTPATYKINDQPAVAISSDSRTVTIAPGFSVTLLKAGTAEITVSHNMGSVSSALSSLATAHNAAIDEIDKHRGQDAGALQGSSILYTLSQSLRDLIGYSSGSGGVSSLTSLGLTFDDEGKLSLDMTAFSSATDGQFQALTEFLGASSTDGFLKYASDMMNGLEDSTDGVIKTAIGSLETQMTQQDDHIAAEQARIDQLQENLQGQLAAADAMIAALEQQVQFMTGLFEAMRTIQLTQ